MKLYTYTDNITKESWSVEAVDILQADQKFHTLTGKNAPKEGNIGVRIEPIEG